MDKEELEKKFKQWTKELYEDPDLNHCFVDKLIESCLQRGWNECMKYRLEELKNWTDAVEEMKKEKAIARQKTTKGQKVYLWHNCADLAYRVATLMPSKKSIWPVDEATALSDIDKGDLGEFRLTKKKGEPKDES